ncbi:triosephosphate isomerase [Arthrobacter sp. V4I6]|uniref:triose-phosphate isomerase family protein n=1 Tax=unclassified Arthrobacter TaxID=235627 RepID=UPI002786EDD4|nr:MULTISPECIES: triose-phosphate isomerase family protein [unclassified Arthrobacter]MDQ0819631.1 triosephosphate isomerase [Arthrobacter sp. V1I7]MDQ0853812.1 triosephosphate isomerase [Arthrobacter sp. V4I6]
MSLPAKGPTGPTQPRAIIGVSLKMYFGHERTLDWCRGVAGIAVDHPAVRSGEIELFALPAHPVLAEAARILGAAGAASGAQDIFWEDEGAFTGEVGGKIIAEVGGRFAEVGHAERRRIFGEDDDVIGLKTAAAYRNGLTPVLCVGEPGHGTAADAVRHCIREIDAVLNRAESLGQSGRTIVAYEPQWAIGAAEPATPSFISDVIRGLDAHLRSRTGQADSRVIYGGSAGPGLIGQLDPAVAGLFLGRFAHDPKALRTILDETAERLGLLAGMKMTA